MATSHTPSKGAKPDKMMRDALMLALNREAIGADGKPTKKLNLIADKLVELAISGDVTAIKEISDRVDGKPAQAITGPEGGPILIGRIERVIVDPRSEDPEDGDTEA